MLDITKVRERHQFDRLSRFKPTKKQAEFIRATAEHFEVMYRANNQGGKSEGGAYFAAVSATGLYPPDFRGRRFDAPARIWCCGQETRTVRNVQQKKLFGEPSDPESLGTGLIPKDLIIRRTLLHGSSDSFNSVAVRHSTGGASTLSFKTYEQGRAGHQGEPVNLIWDDEEVPMDIYQEHLARLAATSGLIIVTMTPLLGRTPLIRRYEEPAPGRILVRQGIRDLLGEPAFPSYTRERVEEIIATFEPHLREARAFGEPVVGSGSIFTTPEADIKFDPHSLDPALLSRLKLIWGIDFGIGHPFAAVLIGQDPDFGTIYLLDGFKIANLRPVDHVPRMRAICSAAPVAWPRDGASREHGSGEMLIELYKKPMEGMPGLKVRDTHATWPEGGISTEKGVALMQTLFSTGKLKVAAHLVDFFDEFRDYRRDEKGEIVKSNDDLLSSLRTSLMDLRYARPGPMGETRDYGRQQYRDHYANDPDNDWDVFDPSRRRDGSAIGGPRLVAREHLNPPQFGGESNWPPTARRTVLQ